MSSEVTSLRVHVRHLRQAKPRSICIEGAKRWWEKKNLDWSQFVTEGIDSQVLLGTGCALAKRVVAAAQLEANRGR